MKGLNIVIDGSLINPKYSMDYDVQSRVIQHNKNKIQEQVNHVMETIHDIIGYIVSGYTLTYNYIKVDNDKCKATYNLTYTSPDNSNCFVLQVVEEGDEFKTSMLYKDKHIVSFPIMKMNKINPSDMIHDIRFINFVEIAKDLIILNRYAAQ